MSEAKKIKRNKRALNRSFGGNLTIFIVLSLLGVIFMLPLVYSVSQAFKPLDELWTYPPKFFVRSPTFRNFKDLFGLLGSNWMPFSRYLFNTVFISVVGTVGHIIVASMCAYVLSKHDFMGKKVIFNIIVFSLMFSTVVTQVPNFLIMTKLKLINTYGALVIPALGSSLGLYLMKQFMDSSIPDTLLEAAKIDGSSEWRIFWRIVMPLVKPAWLTLVLFSFQGLWNTGATALIQTESLKTLNYAMNQILAGGIARSGASAAATLVMMIVPITVFIVTQSNIVETMATSGMKE
ncbi:MAG: carbohydrate ABC transporter permease [Clostridia bacterium]|nr:carbohydrate ABC transporter permease [Clostridia bacterium]